jgi:hypothetical protein
VGRHPLVEHDQLVDLGRRQATQAEARLRRELGEAVPHRHVAGDEEIDVHAAPTLPCAR